MIRRRGGRRHGFRWGSRPIFCPEIVYWIRAASGAPPAWWRSRSFYWGAFVFRMATLKIWRWNGRLLVGMAVWTYFEIVYGVSILLLICIFQSESLIMCYAILSTCWYLSKNLCVRLKYSMDNQCCSRKCWLSKLFIKSK